MARKNLTPSSVGGPEAAARQRAVLIYIRVSTDAQASNLLSLEDQETQLLAQCKRENERVAGIYREEGETATNMRRRAFEDMIERHDFTPRRMPDGLIGNHGADILGAASGCTHAAVAADVFEKVAQGCESLVAESIVLDAVG